MGNGRKPEKILKYRERGGATIIALITVMAAFLLAATYLYLSQAELRITTRYVQSRQALYLAEAGIALAKSQLAPNPLWLPLGSYPIGAGSFSLEVTQAGSGYRIVSLGQAGTALRKLEVYLAQGGDGRWITGSYQELFN